MKTTSYLANIAKTLEQFWHQRRGQYRDCLTCDQAAP